MKLTNSELADLAICNIELISQLIGKCEDLHDINPQDISYSLDSSVRLIKENQKQKRMLGVPVPAPCVS